MNPSTGKTEGGSAIQWFPGHMAKAERMMAENMKLVDAVCEILDARIPGASRNPDIDRLAGGKARLLILNRADLADPEATAKWRAFFRERGLTVLETDAKSGKGVSRFPELLRTALRDLIAANEAKGQGGKALRAMVLGIPNVGKSTFINALAGRKAAQAADRPGVTRGKQWISVGRGLELLDTPGILWPKFDSQAVGEALALTGAVKQEVFDTEALAAAFLGRLGRTNPDAVAARYKLIPHPKEEPFALLEQAARKRGFLISGGEPDTERMARTVLDEYRSGKLGRITLELPEETN